jgi:WD40 repeat protein
MSQSKFRVSMRAMSANSSLLGSALQAMIVSLAVVLGLAIVEGAVLVRMGHDWGYRILSDPYRAALPIDCAIIDSRDTAVCLVRVAHREQRCYQYRIAIHSLRGLAEPVEVPWDGPPFRLIAAIPQSSGAIVGCSDGQMYWIDAAAPAAPPRYFARHESGSLDDLACSSDGRRLVSLGMNGVSCWDVLERKVIWRRDDARFTSADFHPDGRQIAIGLDDGPILQVDAQTGTTVRTIVTVKLSPTRLNFSPDGVHLAFVSGVHTMVLDWESGQPRWTGRHRGLSVAFSPDSRLVASSAFDPKRQSVVILRKTSTGDEAAALAGHRHCILGAGFAADGSVYSWSMDGTIRHWAPGSKKHARAIPVIK